MLIRFAITFSRTSELIVTKRKIFLTQNRALQKLLQVFLFLHFRYLFRNQKQQLVTGIFTLLRLAEISNWKYKQKSNNCLKLYLEDNMGLFKLRTLLSKISTPIFSSHLKSIHSRQIEAKKLYTIPNTQLNFRDCIVTDRCNL